MKLIPTTATAVQKLKSRAKELVRSSDASYQQALELAAKEAGYESWHHVRWCLEQSSHGNTSEPEDGRAAERSRFIRENQEYMEYLATKARGATIQRFPVKGDTFHSIEVDGNYFYGAVGIDGPSIVRRSQRVRGYEIGWVQLGVAEINFTSQDYYVQNPLRPKSWFICKYGPAEPRIDLTGLSPATRYAVAHEFGIKVNYPFGEPLEPPPQDARYSTCDWFPFYLSPAFRGLCDLAKLHPRKARTWGGNSYLGNWGDMARAGEYIWADDPDE